MSGPLTMTAHCGSISSVPDSPGRGSQPDGLPQPFGLPNGEIPSTQSPLLPGWGLGEVALGILLAQFLGAVVGIAVSAAAGWTTTEEIPMWGVALLQLPLWAGWIVAVVVAGRKGNGVRRDFGFTARLSDVPIGAGIGVLLQLVVLPLLYLPILQLLNQTSDDLSEPARKLADRADSPVSWILLLLIVGVGAPVVEELFYRGLLMRSLVKKGLPGWLSVLLTAGIFAAMHLEPLQFVGLFVFGAVAGALALRTGRLGPAIAAHVGFNVTTVIVLWVSSS